MRKNLLIISLLFFASCKKESGADGDSQSPIILLTAPNNNQAYAAGQTVTITASVSDNQKIRSIHLEIMNTATGAFLTHEHYAPDGTSYQLNKTFVAQPTSTYKIKIEAEDSNENKARSEVNIVSN